MDIFYDSINKITNAYKELKLNLGWRFLYSPIKTLSIKPIIMFMGLNPGGDKYCKPIESVELGNAFRLENWGKNNINDLQKQVILLFKDILNILDTNISVNDLMDNTLTVNFCPFRSPSWKKMDNKANVLRFSNNLWSNIFSKVKPKMIICMDDKVLKNLILIFIDLGFKSMVSKSILIGWGNVTIKIVKMRNEIDEISIIKFPHLSRYKIFGKQHYEKGINEVMNYIGTILNK